MCYCLDIASPFSLRLYLWPAFSKIPEMTIVKYVKLFLSWSSAQSAPRFAREQVLLRSYDDNCTAALESVVPQACIAEIVSKGLKLSEFVSSSDAIIAQKFGSQYWSCNAPLGSVDSQGKPLLCAFNRNVVGSCVCETCRTEHTGWTCGVCSAQNQVGTMRCNACKLPNIKSICGPSAVFLECERMYAATVIQAPTIQKERHQLPATGVNIEFALKAFSGKLLSVKVKSPSDDSVGGGWKPELEMLPSGTTATRRDVFRFIACANGKFRIQSVLNSCFLNYRDGSLALHPALATEFMVQPGVSSTPTICISASSDSFICLMADGHLTVSTFILGRSNSIVQFELIQVSPPRTLLLGQAPPKNSTCQFAYVALANDAPEKIKQKGPLKVDDKPEAPKFGVISDCAKSGNWNRLRINGYYDYDPNHLVIVDPRADLRVSLFCIVLCNFLTISCYLA